MKSFKFSGKQKHAAVTAALGLTLAVSGLGLSACSLSSHSVEPLQKISLTESELDQPIASYTYNGKSHDITPRQVFEEGAALESAKEEDSKYKVPGADMILSYARNQILVELTKSANIEVNDDEALKFLKDNFQIESFDDFAKNYHMTEDQVKKTMKENVAINKLRDQILHKDSSASAAPQAPTSPEKGKESEATEAYAQYIIGLLGDEWNAETGTWARQDGPFYTSLSASNFDGKTATYEQAQNAYFVAYTNFNKANEKDYKQWSDYLNGELAKASIQMKYLGSF